MIIPCSDANNRVGAHESTATLEDWRKRKAMITPELQERFQILLEEHKRILYKVCNAYCSNRDDRDDLAQEIVLQLWRSFSTFDNRGRFSTWMYRIALNVAISFYRCERTRTQHVREGDEGLLNLIEAKENETEEILMLYQFIEGLDPLNRGLMLLYLDGNSYQEIADVLGISETNVATKLSRLKHSMKMELCVTEPE